LVQFLPLSAFTARAQLHRLLNISCLQRCRHDVLERHIPSPAPFLTLVRLLLHFYLFALFHISTRFSETF
jgi:hypothetical protein